MTLPAPLRRVPAVISATVALALAAASATAQVDPRIEPDTGRDLRSWVRVAPFDQLSMTLWIDIEDMSRDGFSALSRLTVAPVGGALTSIQLDAGKGLVFRSVAVEGLTGEPAPADFSHADGKLTVELPAAAAPGVPFTLVMRYDATDPGNDGAGLTWSDDDRDSPEVDPMFHSQGEAESNHLWFPCFDYPSDRLSSEIIVTVPSGFDAVSNGRLVSVAHQEGRTTFHWRQTKEHVPYLVALVVSRFDIVNVGGPQSARPGLWMPVYGPLGSAGALRRNFAKTSDMIAFFEEVLDEPYPWDKFGNVMCRDFAAGAMENTSIVTWGSFAATAPVRMVDPINAHEMFHHWFGDLMTCRSWEHLWLNEGFATLGTALWAEHVGGRDAYYASIMENVLQDRAMSRAPAPFAGGVATKQYTAPEQRFFSANNVYSKGCVVLHMLRRRLGDEAFFAGLRLYIDQNKFTQVETDQLRRAMEEASGQSLEQFFDQWVYRPGYPQLDVEFEWDDAASRLAVHLRQTQVIDVDNPAFAFTLPIHVGFNDATSQWLYVPMDGAETTVTFDLPAAPTRASVDPLINVMHRASVTKPLAWWIEELDHAQELPARLAAAEALSRSPHPAAREALAAAAEDARAHPLIRRFAAESLAQLTASDAEVIH